MAVVTEANMNNAGSNSGGGLDYSLDSNFGSVNQSIIRSKN